MTTLCTYECCLHTTDTATDDSNRFQFLGRLEVIFSRLHSLWVQGTPCKPHCVTQILRVGVSFTGRKVKAAAVAAYAGFDVLCSILQQLRNPFRVSEELAGHADGIYFSIRNGLGTDFGIHSPGAYHRNIHKLLDVCNIGKITVLWHVHGRMRPVPRIVGAIVSVEHVISCVLKILCCPLGLLHIPPDLGIIFTRHGAVAESFHLGLYGITQRYRVIIPAGFFDGFNNLRGKAISIFKVTAIFISALVEKLDGKLIKKVSFVNRVYFHSVHTSIFAELCRFCKRFNDFMNLRYCDFRAFDIVCPARRLR